MLPVAKSTYPIRLSYSTLELVHSCERKFQLTKLLVNSNVREESEHFSFGKGFGAGVATYLVTQDANRALYEAWLAYWPEVETDKKNIARCIAAVQVAIPKLDSILMDYEVVSFKDKPAVELSFRLNTKSRYYYVGYIDVVLRNRYTGIYVVFECKTTGLALHDLSPLYRNSGQALGYSIALDRIVGKELAEYGVLYFVAQLGKDFMPQIQIFDWSKTLVDRLNWFVTLGLDIEHLKRMEEMNIYPRRGDSCLTYNKPCNMFGVCTLHTLDEPKIPEPDKIEYDFTYDLDSLVADHVRRITTVL